AAERRRGGSAVRRAVPVDDAGAGLRQIERALPISIDQVHSREDFDRLVQLIESIIAYHKAEKGK
ncbi:MAG: type III-A CRISPR-associated protein Csm2, partial [Cyanobacteriota bacterium]